MLGVVDLERPEPEPTEVLVRVRAAGVNPVDWKARAGLTGLVRAEHLPFVPGWDVSGTVEAVAYGVTRFRHGDDVYGMPWFPRRAGAYAEYVTAPVHAQLRAYAAAGLDEVVLVPATAGDAGGERTLTGMAGLRRRLASAGEA